MYTVWHITTIYEFKNQQKIVTIWRLLCYSSVSTFLNLALVCQLSNSCWSWSMFLVFHSYVFPLVFCCFFGFIVSFFMVYRFEMLWSSMKMIS